ncbi:MAG TPA: DUF4360 domain-containing protein [Streptomyces sp.]|uniref:DUF4360 domain-containing protein n=1 Tax=Streptomyces sp. TaxID=1931 RepID=UPI002D6FCD5A|nr:DUF4360 domain-containing protein [Streptomyces sp.]HZG05111.1 DUF4360 domain-containing protein [Streptomyces sp.]
MPGVLAAGGAVAALYASLLSPQSAPAAAEAPPEAAEINVVTVNGSGCPAGTATVAMSPGNTAFTVTYDEYLVQVGMAAGPTDFRKNCQLNLRIDVPAGYTYSISGVEHRGYGLLQRGAGATQRTDYYFQGSAETGTASHEFTGPYQGSWRTTDSAVDRQVWAPCGEQRNLNINTSLRVDAGTSPENSVSFMAMRSTSTSSSSYKITWRRC